MLILWSLLSLVVLPQGGDAETDSRPAVERLVPSEGSELGGEVLVIQGRNLGSVKSVRFNDRYIPTTDLRYPANDREVVFTAPPLPTLCVEPVTVGIELSDDKEFRAKLAYTYLPERRRWDIEPALVLVPRLDSKALTLASFSWYPWRGPGVGAPLGRPWALRNRFGVSLGVTPKVDATRVIKPGIILAPGLTYRVAYLKRLPLNLTIGVVVFQRADRKRSRPEVFFGISGTAFKDLIETARKYW